MKSTKLLLVLSSLIMLSCEQNVADDRRGQANPEPTVDILDLPDGYGTPLSELAQRSGFSTDDIMNCVLSSTLDMCSHNWIYKFDDTGRFSYAILLRWSDHDQNPDYPNSTQSADDGERRLEAFRETIVNGKLHRTHLVRREANQELTKIEDYLIDFIGQKKYRFYYEGGSPEEPVDEGNVEGASSDDPFAKKVDPISQQDVRALASRSNHQIASAIACLIHEFRKIEAVEQADPSNR